MDKNQAMFEYLLNCKDIKDTQLYFNIVDAQNNATQLLPLSSDRAIETPYINGSVKRRYAITIMWYKSMSDNPLVKMSGISNENIADMGDVQKLVDWISEQNKLKNYPDFGDKISIEKMQSTANMPRLEQIDTTQTLPLAKYSITIQIDYIDSSDVIWG